MSSVPTTHGGDNRVPQPTSNVYKAKIIDQMMTVTHEGDTRIILTVKLTALLKDAHDPGAGAEPCEAKECEVWITVPGGDDDAKLSMALRDLERLDFKDDDISRLHPEHPETVSLVDKEVHVRCKQIGDFEYWNLAWPREKPKAVSVAELQQTTSKLKDKIGTFRKNKGNKKGAKAASSKAGK